MSVVVDPERQAEEDAKLMEMLRAVTVRNREEQPYSEEELDSILATPSEALRPLSRAERRAAVKEFASNLRALPRALPVRNPTIITKSERRRRKS